MAMNKKRRADTELTQDNWNEEEISSEPTTGFSRASDEELAKRKIMPAKRRLGNQTKEGDDSSSMTDSGTGSLFKGFKGFSSTAGSTDLLVGQSSAFSGTPSVKLGGGNAEKPLSVSFGAPKSDDAAKSTMFSGIKFGSEKAAVKLSSGDSKPILPSFLTGGPGAVSLNVGSSQKTSSEGVSSSSEDSLSADEYEEQLRNLNRSVLEWITQHVKENALCDLTPVFDDYKKHITDLDRRAESSPPSGVEMAETVTTSSATTASTRAPAVVDSSATKKVTGGTVSFGSMPTFPLISSTSSSSLTSSTSLGAGFFSSAVAAASSASTAPNTNQTNGEQSDEEAEQESDGPAPEFDEDADVVHSIRAKLFYKKDDSWADLAVGMFKVINLDGKTQLLMRNDTRLGNILLNVMLSSSTPCTRSGKNNVMLVAVPNPPLGNNSSTAVTYLIRVKTTADADELHKKIDDRKKMA